MPKVQVFDPPMCCSTGVCGPEVDPALARFAADLEWLKVSGVEVERFNLGHDPASFAGSPAVAQAIREKDGELPLVLVDGQIVARGSYPAREVLAELAGIAMAKGIYTEAVRALVAVGAAIAANCQPCFRHHFDRAQDLGVSKEDLARAIATAQMVKEAPARAMVELAEKHLGAALPTKQGPEQCGAAASREPGAAGPGPSPKSGC